MVRILDINYQILIPQNTKAGNPTLNFDWVEPIFLHSLDQVKNCK